MVKVLDAAFPGWTHAQLKAAGIPAVGRYVAWTPNSKVITKGEYDSLVADGIGVFLVWESTGKDYAGGYAAGYRDGVEARRQARVLAHPDACGIYSTIDTGAHFSQVVADYQRGFNDAGNVGIQGFYGDVEIGHALLDAGLIDHFWQTNARAWPGDSIDSPRAVLIQRTSHSFPGVSGSYDESDVFAVDFGQNPRPAAPGPKPVPKPTPPTYTTTDHGDAAVKTTEITGIHLDHKGDGNVPAPAGTITNLLVKGGSDPNEVGRYDARPTASLTADGKFIVLIGGVPSGTYTVVVSRV